MSDKKPLVTIRCITYNHDPYIRQCLEGFVMQKTNFPFEAIVHDDASTDGTAAIIREYAEKYPDIIKPIYETVNQYSKHDGSLRKIMDAHTRGKYIAMCEGDDYWTDPLKLQKQVDFLEGHSEYILSHTAIMYYFQDLNRFVKSRDVAVNMKVIEEGFVPQSILLNKYRIQTLSVLFRTDAYFAYINSLDKVLSSGYFLMGDTPLWYTLAKMGKFHFLSDETCVYRKHSTSVTGERNLLRQYRFRLSSYELRYYLSLRDNLPPEVKEKFKRIYAIRLMEYMSLNPSFHPYFSIRLEDYKGFHYTLYKLGILSIFIKMRDCFFYCLRRIKNNFRKFV